MKSIIIISCFLLPILIFGQETINTESYSYDQYGRLIGVAYDNSTNINYTYDFAGNILEVRVEEEPSSIDEFENENEIKISLHPIPAQSYFMLNLELKNPSEIQIFIYNNLGAEVQKFFLESGSDQSNVRIDVSSWPSGTYFCSIKSKDSVNSTKLTVMH